jgi:hypothetical protein
MIEVEVRRGLRSLGAGAIIVCAATSPLLRKISERNEPVVHDGKEIALPYHGPGWSAPPAGRSTVFASPPLSVVAIPPLDTVESVKRFSESAQVFGASGSGPRSSVDVAA